MRALTAIVLGMGVLGAGCGERIYDSVAEKAKGATFDELIYVHDAATSPDNEVQGACSRKFPEFKTRAVRVRGLNKKEEIASLDVCCILKQEVYGYTPSDTVYIKASYCTKMSQPLEIKEQ
ncbi:MAG: hypothetical protein QME12_04190 [Nanoarchaeota archaeon]|nr:hypothetical protein [Nanoarchaeota archaeon]